MAEHTFDRGGADDGTVTVSIFRSYGEDVVYSDLEPPVTGFGLTADQARAYAADLITHADALDQRNEGPQTPEQDEQDAELLRQAADRMRQDARGAVTSASGRWYVRTPQGGYPQSISDNASATLVADCHEGPQHPQATAPFIASWDPPVALAAAELLFKTAEIIAMNGSVPSTRNAAALQLARTYLRRTGAADA
jgi:hypothetical protein